MGINGGAGEAFNQNLPAQINLVTDYQNYNRVSFLVLSHNNGSSRVESGEQPGTMENHKLNTVML